MHKIIGEKKNVSYVDRVGAYLLPFKDGKIGIVQTPKGFFLLGGGLEEKENDAACIQRECLEEIGYKVFIKEKLCSGEMYYFSSSIGYFHPIQTYYTGELLLQCIEPIEKSHTLVWKNPEELIGKMVLEIQSWAIEQAIK